MAKPGPPRITGRIYWPNCAVCQFMRKNPRFRDEVMASTYFDPVDGKETLKDVVSRWKLDVSLVTVYGHMRRHQAKDVIKAEARLEEVVPRVLEGQVASEGEHEVGLDEFINKGRRLLAANQLNVTAATYLQAIKVKAEIERTTKDRRLDALKLMAGASGIAKRDEDGETAAG